MKKSFTVFVGLICALHLFSQTIDITGNPSTSATSAFGSSLFVANESIYTETEIGTENFTSAATAINKIGFNVAAVGAATNFSLIKIYMMEVPNSSSSMATGAYSTAGYTQVFGGAGGGNVILSVTGFTEISLSTPFVRTTGNNLQVLIERVDNVNHGGFIYRTANGNHTGSTVLSGRRYNNTTALSSSTSLTASSFRAQIRLKHEFAADAALQPIYSLGKLPINNAVPHIITTNVLNNGSTTLTGLSVTLNITGANNFTDIQTIPSLAPGTSTAVNFTAFTPTGSGTNNVTVTVPADDNNANNSTTIQQIVNSNTWSYSQGNTNTGTAGVAGNTIDFATKYYNSAATVLSQAAVYFLANGQPFKLAVWDASGVGGRPGNLLFETTTLSSIAGLNLIPIVPAISIPIGDFYIGVKQTTTTNFNLLRQTESPLRGGTFYFSSPTGSAWVDNSMTGTNRFMIDPKSQTSVDAFVTKLILPNNGAPICSDNNVTISAEIVNVGSSIIAANAASITLKIAGANPQILISTNAAAIASGATGLINFTGVNLSNPGLNFDTVYVSLAGDAEVLNNTVYSTQTTIANNVALQTVVNTYSLSAGCEEMGWTFYKDSVQNSVLAVEWGNNNAAKASALATITLNNGIFSVREGSGASAKGTFIMQRIWNIDIVSTTLSSPVKVRFFYSATEKAETDIAASTIQQNNPGSVVETPRWFKTNSGAFVADAAHVTADAVLNSIQLIDVNTGGNTINGVLYAQFNNVNSFSGGTYATGIGPSSVLPVNIAYFRGSKQGEENILNWKINCVGSVSLKVIVERSSDGKTFNTLTEQTVSEARCLQAFSQIDASPLVGINYYRIVTITPDGKKLYSSIVALINKSVGFEIINLAPSPVLDKMTINFTTSKADTYAFQIIDNTGAIIFTNRIKVAQGNTTSTMNLTNISSGIYALKMIAANGESRIIRFVKL